MWPRENVGNISLFTTCLFTILVPLFSPLPNSEVMYFILIFHSKDLTLPKFRPKRIMNKRAFLKMVPFVCFASIVRCFYPI